MTDSLPVKTNIVLWKVDGNWAYNIVYPPGTASPKAAKPFTLRNEDTLEEMYDELRQLFNDERLSGGHPPGVETSDEELENGTLVVLDRHQDSWRMTVYDRNGGLQARVPHYQSVRDALQDLKEGYGER